MSNKKILCFALLFISNMNVTQVIEAQISMKNDINNNNNKTQEFQKIEKIFLEQPVREVNVHIQTDFKASLKTEFEKNQKELNKILNNQNNLNLQISQLAINQKVMLDALTKALGELKEMKRQVSKLVYKASAGSAMIQKYDENLNCIENCDFAADVEWDCAKILEEKHKKSGVYLVSLSGLSDLSGGCGGDGGGNENSTTELLRAPFGAFCERSHFDEKGWIIIQRRQDGAVNFYRNWHDYKYGFGYLNGEYWLGLERLHAMTSSGIYELWIEMETLKGEKSYARYSKFFVDSEKQDYTLKIDGFSGNASGDSFSYNKGRPFQTFDKNKRNVCVEERQAGWWYAYCTLSNLNGLYKNSTHNNGIYWDIWHLEPLKYVHMAIHRT